MRTFAVINRKKLYVVKFETQRNVKDWAIKTLGNKSETIIKEIESDFYEFFESSMNYEN